MSAATDLIETGLDEFFDYQRRQRGAVVARRFTRRALAACIEMATGVRPTPADVSYALQEYRLAQDRRRQARTPLKYTIAARGDARSAKWFVHAGPGLDPLEGEAMVLAHVEWVTSDLGRRCTSDTVRELLPGASTFPTIAKIVDQTAAAVATVLQQMVDRARAENDFYEQVTGRLVLVDPPLTQDEEQLLGSLNGPTP